MGQFMQLIQNLALEQEELGQNVQRVADATIDHVNTPGVNLNQREVPLNHNVKNTIQIPVNGAPYHENIFESSYDTFRFPIDGTKSKKRLHILEERMKAIEVRNSLGLDASSLCLVPGIKIPAKFKVPTIRKI